MDIPATTPVDLPLRPQGLLRLPDAAGVHITCREGSLWITLDGDPRDVVLERGQSFTTGEHRRALVYALEASRVRVCTEPAVQSFPWQALRHA